MQSQPQEQSHRPRVEDEFRENLRLDWTRPVACQNECSPPGTCRCQRKIVHVKAIEKWWSEQLTESPGQTRGHLFLDEMREASHRTFPPEYSIIFTGEGCCVRVLSLLLQQGRDCLIDLFYTGAMHDKYLVRGANYQVLRKTLLEKMQQKNVDTIIEEFHRDKWAYCPMELTLGMSFNGHGTKVIPPFCSKIKLPDKGGTASIYWVAVQKDLISDDALACALHDSLYHDEEYGECYQMILKSYSGNKKSVFDLEKQAFAGLNSKKDVPILQYLGSYTHDYGEGGDMGETYNILLEYGDNDLYQAWADATNVPPVRAQEILRTWNSLFEIAKAIRHVHHLEVPRGGGSEPRRFHGWHADIKPDNILGIRGQLKLSDFGFSSFAPVIKGHDRSVPTEFIKGFTDTYGAPEVFRMKGADGTLSGVTQSIDIWSYGCVLSVAATWIVLGFQGIRQYEQLRQLATSNCQDKTTHDRFHDGTEVLPEIRQWHDYLRGHLRASDTTTEQVLTLIENKLLKKEPSQRPDSEKLCKELQTIHKRAEREIEDLPPESKEAGAAVLRALSMIEERARSQKPPTTMPTDASQFSPPQWASMQSKKDNMINHKPLGQTPYRQEILRKELGENTFGLPTNGDRATHSGHNGGFTQSPTHSTSVQGFQFPSLQPTPMKYQSRQTEHTEREAQPYTVDDEVGGQSATPKTPTPQHRHDQPQDGKRRDRTVSSDSYSTPNPRTLSYTMGTTGGMTLEGLPSTSQQTTSKAPLVKITTTQALPLSPPYSPENNKFSRDVLPEQSSLGFQALNCSDAQNSNSKVASPSSKGSIYNSKQDYNPGSPMELRQVRTSTSNPTSLLEPFQSPTTEENMQARYSDTYIRSEQGLGIQVPASSHGSPQIVQELLSVLDLPYSICKKRKMLDQKKPGTWERFTRRLTSKEDRKIDPNLKDMSSDGRELVFIVDNGSTMSEHWPIVTFVVETLATNAAGIDKSGIDLRFTVDSDDHNKNDLVGDAGRRTLREKLAGAWPERRQQDNGTSGMVAVFQKVYQEWEVKEKPATTLYVFTDGKWAKENLTALNKIIVQFAKHDRRDTGKRHFSIQLIRFGDDETDKSNLQWLDDELCSSFNIRDIIDHCSWRASVDKIFKGSIEGFQDEKDDEELPILYDYKELVEKFNKFNKGEEIPENTGQSSGLLSPSSHSVLPRSPSQRSGRSFMSTPREQNPIPPETPKRHSKFFSRSSLSPQ